LPSVSCDAIALVALLLLGDRSSKGVLGIREKNLKC